VALIVALLASAFACAGGFECWHLPWVVVDGSASATVQTWQDMDGDGQQGPGEPPLPWITIGLGYEQSLTDSSGHGTLSVFKPGCACRCWEGEVVSADIPPGYRATTPTRFEMSGPDLAHQVGFQIEESVPLLALPDEPDWFRAFLNRGLALVDFHYAINDRRLSISLDGDGGIDRYDLYLDVFNVISTLEKVEAISVEETEITLLPSSETIQCDMRGIKTAVGMSLQEVVSSYCLNVP
jgi:hypothetical protein